VRLLFQSARELIINMHTTLASLVLSDISLLQPRALTKFVFSGDDDSKSVTMETTMTVADFSGEDLGVSGATMLSAFLLQCT
jgi:hypothetical protein